LDEAATRQKKPFPSLTDKRIGNPRHSTHHNKRQQLNEAHYGFRVVGRSRYAAEKTFPIGAQIAQVCFAVEVAPPSSFRESLRDGFLKKQAHYELQSLDE